MPNPHVKSTTFSQPLNNEALKRATISGVHCSIEREVGYIHNSEFYLAYGKFFVEWQIPEFFQSQFECVVILVFTDEFFVFCSSYKRKICHDLWMLCLRQRYKQTCVDGALMRRIL